MFKFKLLGFFIQVGHHAGQVIVVRTLTADMLARLKSGDKLCCRDFSDFLMAYLDGELGGDVACRFDRLPPESPPPQPSQRLA